MGCDIHIWAEIKPTGADEWDNWEFLDINIDSSRNYDIFSLLADVRNGYGFAGIDTGDPIKPISEPKGIPDNASYLYRGHVQEWSGDGHSHSFLTLKELIDARDDSIKQTKVHRGVVSVDGYKDFLENGEPHSYSGSVSGNNVVHISNKEMDKLIAGKFNKNPDKSYYTKVEWKESIIDMTDGWLDRTIKVLESYGVDSEDIRIVFFFDN